MTVQVHLAPGRTVERKKSLFRALASGLAADHGFRPGDVLVTLVEVPRENWSFGDGVAQYADAPPPHLAGAAAAAG